MKSKIMFVLSLLMGLMFLNSGLNKFFNYMPMPEMTDASMELMGGFMKAKWLMPLIGIAEIVGGILFIIPKFRALGAIILFPILVGIVLLHAVQDPGTIAIPLVLFAILMWVIIDNINKYMPMITLAEDTN